METFISYLVVLALAGPCLSYPSYPSAYSRSMARGRPREDPRTSAYLGGLVYPPESYGAYADYPSSYGRQYPKNKVTMEALAAVLPYLNDAVPPAEDYDYSQAYRDEEGTWYDDSAVEPQQEPTNEDQVMKQLNYLVK